MGYKNEVNLFKTLALTIHSTLKLTAEKYAAILMTDSK